MVGGKEIEGKEDERRGEAGQGMGAKTGGYKDAKFMSWELELILVMEHKDEYGGRVTVSIRDCASNEVEGMI